MDGITTKYILLKIVLLGETQFEPKIFFYTFNASKSQFNDCPIKIESGDNIFIISSCTSVKVVLTSLSFEAVIPEYIVK